MIMISVGLGACFAVGWGGDYATRVEGHRQDLIAKRRLSDSKPDPEVNDQREEDRGPNT